MSGDEIDSFAALFHGMPSARREAREKRAQRERRTQLTDKQRRRGAVRTAQMNFRCSPAFVADVRALQEHLSKQHQREAAIADLMEEAIELLKRKYKFKGADA